MLASFLVQLRRRAQEAERLGVATLGSGSNTGRRQRNDSHGLPSRRDPERRLR
jgi:hypothetical protein